MKRSVSVSASGALQPVLVAKVPGNLLYGGSIGVALIGFIVALLAMCSGGSTPATPETPTATATSVPGDPLNPCDQVTEAESPAAPASPAAAVAGEIPGITVGFTTQNDPRWGRQVYAHADNPLDPECGGTIASCGCAMTSLTNVLRYFGNTKMPDGQEVTPQAVNAYFTQDTVKVANGFKSKGYNPNNNVEWNAITELSADIARTYPGTRQVMISGWGSGSTEELRSELQQGRPAILQLYMRTAGYTGPHFIMAAGLEGDRIIVMDPSHEGVRYLDGYIPFIVNSRLFRVVEPSTDLSGTVIVSSGRDRIVVTDAQGKSTGTLGGANPEQAVAAAANDIPGATINFQSSVSDATCPRKRTPATDVGNIRIFVPGPGPVTVSLGPGPDNTCGSVVVQRYDAQGHSTIQVIEDPDCAKEPSPTPTPTDVPTKVATTVSPSARPTTPVPTTAAPTTAVPTTAVPTTAIPTTAVPTTAVPTTAVPTTAVPTTAVPTATPRAPQPNVNCVDPAKNNIQCFVTFIDAPWSYVDWFLNGVLIPNQRGFPPGLPAMQVPIPSNIPVNGTITIQAQACYNVPGGAPLCGSKWTSQGIRVQ